MEETIYETWFCLSRTGGISTFGIEKESREGTDTGEIGSHKGK